MGVPHIFVLAVVALLAGSLGHQSHTVDIWSWLDQFDQSSTFGDLLMLACLIIIVLACLQLEHQQTTKQLRTHRMKRFHALTTPNPFKSHLVAPAMPPQLAVEQRPLSLSATLGVARN